MSISPNVPNPQESYHYESAGTPRWIAVLFGLLFAAIAVVGYISHQAEARLENLCVWVKDNAGMGSLYRSMHELVFVLRTGRSQHRNNVQLGRFGRNRATVAIRIKCRFRVGGVLPWRDRYRAPRRSHDLRHSKQRQARVLDAA